MHNKQWQHSDNAIAMLEALFAYQKSDGFIHVNDLQLFYVECCKKHIYLLPQEAFKVALDYAIKYINKEASLEEVSEKNWYTEAAVFGMDYDDEMAYKSIYENISNTLNLSINDAKAYAVKLGYFIDWTSLYASSFHEDIPYQYSVFLDSDTLRHIIKAPFSA